MFMIFIALLGAAFLIWFILVALFTPALNYRVRKELPVGSEDFVHVLQTVCQAAIQHGNRIEVFTNGERFYPAMLEAIHGAQQTVTAEWYILDKGTVPGLFVDALAERAQAGVLVTIVVDALGSARLPKASRERLKEAGCRLERYQPITWYRLARLNNRTHREILVVDGRTAFVGGAGIADWWHREHAKNQPSWRDTMVRVEGPIVSAIQGVFAENWLECCGEILTGREFFPRLEPVGDSSAIVVRSSPSDRATVSRVTFELLLEGARREIRISTPYFLPDRPLRRALRETVRRGVSVTVLVPGPLTDQKWVRIASRRNYEELLEAGVRIFEYGPAMTHVKALIIDRRWSVVGTTNIDNRSFEHNDEINLLVEDPAVAERLNEDFERDLSESTEITLERWRARPLWETLIGPVVWILERQQ
ncbi:MAG TPA: phospholipase D-like domain-containing protein [Vicinamibacterales bacterium]|nr:phospholipase D-like domain-containing protein [Vicinamibacterales bacterium]